MSDNEYLSAWRKFKEDHPVAYGVTAILPVTGQVAAIADYADAMDRGDSVDGAIAAASFIPGVGITKAAKVLKGVAPAKHELDVAKAFYPNGARARLAPATENAKTIGLAADSEQIGEISGSEYKKSKDEQRKLEQAEYSKAFGGGV